MSKIINIYDSDCKSLEQILLKLSNIEAKMATFQEVVDAAKAEQDIILAAVTATQSLVMEVKKLLEAGNVVGAQELLDQIAANSQALVEASATVNEVTTAVDAANG